MSRKAALGISAFTLFVTGILPALVGLNTVYAGQVSNRSIIMTNDSPGGSSTYEIEWEPASTTAISQIVVDFCANDPIVTDSTCTVPGGASSTFTVGATPTISIPLHPIATPAGTNNLTVGSGCSWTPTALDQNGTSGNYRTLELSYTGSGCTSLAQTSGTYDEVDLSSVVNPNTACSTYGACTFYARIYTYSTTTTYTVGSTTNVVDDGGVALSTASQISLQATVMEELSFCVYPGASTCGNPVSITLGHAVGGTTVLDDTAVDTAPVAFELGTNAAHGVAVDILGGTLTSGANTIPADTTDATISAGQTTNGDFGLWISTLPTGWTVGTGYTSTSANPQNYNLSSTATTSSEIMSYGSPANNVTGAITYGATAQPTTPPGVYTASHELIATATF